MLFAINLIKDTRRLSIFNTVKSYVTKNITFFLNIIACATDGVLSMVGHYYGFVAYLKEVMPNVLCIQCMLHRQHLVGNI